MAPIPIITLYQGAGPGTSGVALIGTVGAGIVTCVANTPPTAIRWRWSWIGGPPGSAIVRAQGVQDSKTLTTYSFTPDVAGGYLLQLDEFDANGAIGTAYLMFVVLNTSSRLPHIPPMQPFPGFATPDPFQCMNFPGHQVGWTDFMEEYYAAVDAGSGLAVTGSGVLHATAGSVDGVAYHGITAGQVLTTNDALTDAIWSSSVLITGGNAAFAVPIIGQGVPYGAVNGVATGDATTSGTATETATAYQVNRIEYGQVLVGNLVEVYPTPSSANGSYERTIVNNTTGAGYTFTVKCGAGSVVVIPPGATYRIAFKSTGDALLVSGVTASGLVVGGTASLWTTFLDLDTTALGTHTFATDGAISLGGYAATKFNSAHDATSLNVGATGLAVTPDGSTTDFNNTVRTFPGISFDLPTLLGSAYDPTMSVRVWASVSAQNFAANYDAAVIAIETGNTMWAEIMKYGYNVPGVGHNTTFNYNGNNIAGNNFDAVTPGSANATMVLEWNNTEEAMCRSFHGALYAGSWPSPAGGLVSHAKWNSVGSQTYALKTNQTLKVSFGAQRYTSATSLVVKFNRLRIDVRA